MYRRILILLFLMIVTSGVYVETTAAGRPLITDEASTQGKGKWLVEAGVDYARDEDDIVRASRTTLTTELDYGLADNLDLTLISGYQRLNIHSPTPQYPDGVIDSLLEVKWRLYENGKGLNLAVKPGIMLPTGDHKKGIGCGDYRFGTGEVRYRLHSVVSQYFSRSALHLNLGYLQNENRYDARAGLWHASLAGEWRIERWRIVGNVGVDTAPDKETVIDPVWALAGIIYAVSDALNVNLGVKRGLNDPGYDITLSGGITYKF